MVDQLDAFRLRAPGHPTDQPALRCRASGSACAVLGKLRGPHTYDVALREILPVLFEANVGGFMMPFANPRHQHEIGVFRDLPLKRDQYLIAGVIDTLTNFVEHPEVVAQRSGTRCRSGRRPAASSRAPIALDTRRHGPLPRMSFASFAMRDGADIADRLFWRLFHWSRRLHVSKRETCTDRGSD